MKTDNERGAYRKYRVTKIDDPKGKHDGCEFFVLDWRHDKFAIDAGIEYANRCRAEFPKLAEDLEKIVMYYSGFHGIPLPEIYQRLGKRP